MTIARTVSTDIQRLPDWAKNTLLIIGSSLLLGLTTHLVIPLPFTPIPIATRVTVVLLLGVFLGSKRAPLAVAAFLAQGAMGFPVFAKGAAGMSSFSGPTAGYLFGYLVASYVVGKIIEKSREKTLSKAFFAMGVGNLIILAFGAGWLSNLVGINKAFFLGVAPFLIGDFLKLTFSVKILQWMRWAR